MSVSFQIDNENQQLKVTWDDGHVSPFKYSWLNNHSFTEEAAEKQDNLLFRKPTLWGKELQDKYPTADFDKVNIVVQKDKCAKRKLHHGEYPVRILTEKYSHFL